VSGVDIEQPSSYLRSLPGIYQQDAERGAFIGRYLKIFEKILAGIEDGVLAGTTRIEGIEQIIARIYGFFDPSTAPKDFLSWLASWMALMLRDDWEEVKKRRLLGRIMSLYRIRGTKKALEEYIRIYVVEGGVEITEVVAPLQIGVTSTIGEDTYIGGGPPHFFVITVTLPEPDLELKARREAAVRAIIDLEKPAHTYYELITIVPTLQIGKFSTIGKDTLLGDIPKEG
jgi:phage tail-like protein